MKKKLVSAVMMFLTFGLISACGGGGGGGGSGTVPTGAKTTAQTAHDSTTESSNTGNTATQLAQSSSIQLSSLVSAVGGGGCVSNCTVSMDMSGLPGPTSQAPQFKQARYMNALRSAKSPTTNDSYVAGCVHAGSSNVAIFDANGQNGCTSGDSQININYANGDKVEYTWDCPPMGNGCTTTMRVVGGHYSGTYISYSLDWTQFYLDIKTTGRIQYDSIMNYDRCLDQNWHMTWSADNSSGITINATTDFINLGQKYRATSNLTYDMGSNSASESGYWSLGGATRWADIEVPQSLAMLCTAATYSENGHVLEYKNMSVRDDWNANTYWDVSASGSVLYDNTEIGHLDAGDYGSINIHWNDGSVTPFDPWEDMWAGFIILY